MKNSEKAVLTFSPDVWNLMSKVPAQELESALRKAFPQYFRMPRPETKLEDNLQFIEELRTMSVPKPKTDIDEDLITRRAERHSL